MPSGPILTSLSGGLPVAMSGHSSPTTTPTSPAPASPYVTLQPASPSGGIPGDATDPLDFYGILIAVVVIAGVIIAVRLAFRGRGRPYESRRDDQPSR